MKRLKEFSVEIVRLQPGTHDFKFKVDSNFFKNFEYGLIENGDLTVNVKLDRSSTMLNLDFDIEGTIELICDRSLEPFDYELSLHNDLVIKFGEEDRDLADDVVMMKYETQFINLADFIYEFITVAVPMKRLHPKYESEDENEETDSLIYTSGEDHDLSEDNASEDDIDPRWKELLKLKNNK